MLKKMKKKAFPVAVMIAAFISVLGCRLFSVHISSIVMMLAAAAVSLGVFALKKNREKGGKSE